MEHFRQQRTIGAPCSYSGIGIHTGQEVSLRFLPAREGEGVFFRRVDLPGAPVIPATVEYVAETRRGTTIAVGEAKIHTVEHVLAPLRAYEIDNVCIELSGIEPPAGNGSADVFVEMIERVGIVEQAAKIPVASVKTPVWLDQGEVNIVALPSETYKLTYVLHYPANKALGSQHFTLELTQESFREELAACRTFSLYEELSMLMDRGLIRGGSLENAVIVCKDAIISKGGLYFADEAVRHKMLDLIGDLSLVGIPFTAHVIALRSGHASNFAFAKRLYDHLLLENTKP